MAYEGARIPSVSTAPLAIAVPGGPDGVLLLDMASSLISNGRLKNAKRDGTALPPGAALDADGRETQDPARATTLLPMGGAKGAGLALLVECATSLLAGAPILAPMLGAGRKGHGQNAAIILIDVASLREPAQYGAAVDDLVAAIKALPRAPGVDEIRAPGERGAALGRRRRVEGVPVAAKVWAELVALAERHGVSPPPLMNNDERG
jgi:ureidoglycolate dehydrogenase (NAD+)